MSVGMAIELCRAATMISFLVAAPVLVCAVVVGLIVSIFQAVTQLQDQTLSFVPKVAAMGAVLLFMLPWALSRMTTYTTDLFHMIPQSLVQ